MTSNRFSECIDACYRCADACDHCSVACLSEDNVKEMERCIRLDMDCAAVCRLTAEVMARESECHIMVCRLCEKICTACAEECGKHQHEHCQNCAQQCRECAQLCQKMAA